jgi:hypothetical protein
MQGGREVLSPIQAMGTGWGLRVPGSGEEQCLAVGVGAAVRGWQASKES